MTQHSDNRSPPTVLPAQASARETALCELALDFCRECLGWSSASPNGRSIVENRRRPENPHLWTKAHGFHLDPRDVSHVINAVAQWSDLHGCSLLITYSPGQEEKHWSVRIAPHAEIHGHTVNELLMRACLAANRVTPSMGQAHPAETPLTRNNPAIFAKPWGDVRINGPIALAFCNKFLGWKNARLLNDFGYLYIAEKVEKKLADTSVPPWERRFHFNENHMDKVIAAVCAWCDARASGFTLEYFPSGSSPDCWRAVIGPVSVSSELASAALMSASVTAQSRLPLPGKTKADRDTGNDDS